MTPKGAYSRIQFSFWSSMVTLMDSSKIARSFTPTGYRLVQNIRNMSWVSVAIVLMVGGLAVGITAGMVAAVVLP